MPPARSYAIAQGTVTVNVSGAHGVSAGGFRSDWMETWGASSRLPRCSVAKASFSNDEALAGSGIHFTKLNATGGGARSKVWMQMKADVLDLPITALRTSDAGTVGSAMLTGIAAGIFKDLGDAASRMVEETETYVPREEMHEQYMKIFERYKAVYEAVRPLM